MSEPPSKIISSLYSQPMVIIDKIVKILDVQDLLRLGGVSHYFRKFVWYRPYFEERLGLNKAKYPLDAYASKTRSITQVYHTLVGHFKMPKPSPMLDPTMQLALLNRKIFQTLSSFAYVSLFPPTTPTFLAGVICLSNLDDIDDAGNNKNIPNVLALNLQVNEMALWAAFYRASFSDCSLLLKRINEEPSQAHKVLLKRMFTEEFFRAIDVAVVRDVVEKIALFHEFGASIENALLILSLYGENKVQSDSRPEKWEIAIHPIITYFIARKVILTEEAFSDFIVNESLLPNSPYFDDLLRHYKSQGRSVGPVFFIKIFSRCRIEEARYCLQELPCVINEECIKEALKNQTFTCDDGDFSDIVPLLLKGRGRSFNFTDFFMCITHLTPISRKWLADFRTVIPPTDSQQRIVIGERFSKYLKLISDTYGQQLNNYRKDYFTPKELSDWFDTHNIHI